MKLPLCFLFDKGPISATELQRENKGNPTGDLTIFIVQSNIRIQWLISSSNGNPPQKKITQTTTRYPLFLFIVHLSLLQEPCLPITPVEFPAVAAVRCSAACASKLHKNQTPPKNQQPWRSPRNENENHPNLHSLGLVYIVVWGCHDFFYHTKKTHGVAPEKKPWYYRKVANQSRYPHQPKICTLRIKHHVKHSFIPSIQPSQKIIKAKNFLKFNLFTVDLLLLFHSDTSSYTNTTSWVLFVSFKM